MARPTEFTQEIADRICELLEEGTSLRKICEMEGMPDRHTVKAWRKVNSAFSTQYAMSRQEQAHTYADDIIDYADLAVDRDTAAAQKVKVDARKWVASKLFPKVYGDKIQQEISGPDGGPIPTKDLTDAQLAELAVKLANTLTAPSGNEGDGAAGQHQTVEE